MSGPLPAIPASPRWVRLWAAAVPLAYLLAFLATWNRVGLRDHDHALTAHNLQYWNFQLFGIAKQWTPLLCGGLHLGADPYMHFASFSMLLAYAIGPFAGLRLAAVAYFAVGWLGAYLYAGLCLSERATRALAASLFIGNGFFVARFAYGHLNLIPFTTLPLILLALHRAPALERRLGGPRVGAALLALLLGGGLALVIDGSPQALLHFLAWLGLYALGLAWVERTPRPLALLAMAVGVACILDLGYLWPVVAAAQELPRLTEDDFVSPLNLVYFLLVPTTGAALGSRYMGHEATVFIGPFLAGLIVWARRAIAVALPATLRTPWLLTSVVSIVLGLGSLRLAGWPAYLSPFDLLRPLPGFLSMGATARYWGFLALPLALLAAQAVALYASPRPLPRTRHVVLGLALVLQVGFQLGAIVPSLLASRRYVAPEPPQGYVTRATPDAAGVLVRYVYAGPIRQSALVTPTQGVVDCYDNWDRIRGSVRPGAGLVQSVEGRGGAPPGALDARFKTWSWIRLERAGPGPGMRVVLNQSYNRHWQASAGRVERTASGNLAIVLGAEERAIDLRFDDPASSGGARVSLAAWRAWLVLALVAALVAMLRR